MQSVQAVARCRAGQSDQRFAAAETEDMDEPNLPEPQLTQPIDAPSLESDLRQLGNLTVSVSIQLGNQRMALQSLCQLSPGSILALDMPCRQTQVLVANGLTLATGQLVRSGTRLGFRLQRPAVEVASKK